MCVTNIYVDRYPDGREVEYRHLSTCQYGAPNRPCATHSTQENPVRKIQFNEPTSQFIYNNTPPRSPGHHHISDSHRRPSSSSERRHKLRLPTRTHRKERIIIVDAPPTPRTPPQLYPQTFTAPSSPNPPYASPSRRGRPIIVDERSMRQRHRTPSVGAVISDRPIPIISRSQRRRSLSRPRVNWDTPSTSHTSFDLAREREREREREKEKDREELARRLRRAAAERDAQLDASLRRAQRRAALDEEILSRPAVPFAPPRRNNTHLRPVVDQSVALQGMMGGLSLNDRIGERALTDAAQERRRAERERKERERSEEEALRARLRERQMPRRRFSVGPGGRRHRVLYDDGVYRWE